MKTYDKLLIYGLQELAKNGKAGFCLNSVAKKVGIKPSSIYAFFSSKDELILKCIENAENKFKKININLNLNERTDTLIFSLFKCYIKIFKDETLQNYYKLLRKEALSDKNTRELYLSFCYALETQTRFILEEKLNTNNDEITDKKLSLLSLIFRDSLLSVLFLLFTEGEESALWEAEKISSLLLSTLSFCV